MQALYCMWIVCNAHCVSQTLVGSHHTVNTAWTVTSWEIRTPKDKRNNPRYKGKDRIAGLEETWKNEGCKLTECKNQSVDVLIYH